MSEELSHHALAEVLRVTMYAGKLMLQNGAASFRTEQTMSRVAHLMGVDHLESYVTPTGIIASAYTDHEHRTQILRLNRLGVDMNRVLALEELSRHPDIASITPEAMMLKLQAIEQTPALYPPLVVMLAVGMACGALALILGGGWIECLGATIAAFLAQGLRIQLAKRQYNPLLITTVCAAAATLVGVLIVRLLHAPQPQIGVTASVLLLVPGVPLVTAIIDLSRFDLISGISRGVQALLICASIAIGMLAVFVLLGFNIT